MIFLSLFVALVLVQWWGSGAPVQRDGWFYTWMERLQTVDALGKVPGGYSFVAVLSPCLILALLIWGIQAWLSYMWRSEEHTSELQSRGHLVFRLLLEKTKQE